MIYIRVSSETCLLKVRGVVLWNKLLPFGNTVKKIYSPCLVSVVRLAYFIVFGGFWGVCCRFLWMKSRLILYVFQYSHSSSSRSSSRSKSRPIWLEDDSGELMMWKTKKKFGVVFPFPELTLVSNDVVNAWTCSNRWIKTTGFYMVLSSKLKLGRYQQYKMYTRFHHHGRCDVNTIKS